jgi:putative endopeptidase
MNYLKPLIIAITGIIVLSFFNACSNKGDEAKTAAVSGKKPIDSMNLDNSVKPDVDFYQYANGGWLKRNPVPDDDSRYGAFEELRDENLEALRTMFEQASLKKDAAKGSLEQKVGDFFASGMDTDKIDKDGAAPLKPELEKINSIKSMDELQKVMVESHLSTIFPFFNIYPSQDEKNSAMIIANLYQGGYSLPDRDYYLLPEDFYKNIRTEYLVYIQKMFVLSGFPQDEAVKISQKVLEIETALAKASRSRLDLRDPEKNYNKMPVASLQKLAPSINWVTYFSALGMKLPDSVNVGQPEFFKSLSGMMGKYSLDDWKNYMKWHMINQTADYLSADFIKTSFEFNGKILSGKKSIQARWKQVSNTTSYSIGELVGQLFVKKYFPPEAKTKMLELVGNLRKSLRERIKNLSWMSDATKLEAIAKLEKMNVKIGYPDKWIDYSSLDITRDSYYQNVLNSAKFQMKKEMAKIGKPVDKDEWHMTPQTVNAYYNPNLNEIVFPAAILQYPFFQLHADDAVNYGSIGVVIGHEMTHGFDDQGRQYDKEGNLRDWWAPGDADKFKEKIQPLIDQYNKFVAIKDLKVNGELTVGENIADVGGLIVAFNALKMSFDKDKMPEKIDGFTWEQRFFLSYAQVWRNNIRDEELIKRLKTDVHSPGKFRTNGATANLDEFYSAFGIQPGGQYYLAPEQRAKIW